MDLTSCICFAVIVLWGGRVLSKPTESVKGKIHGCMAKDPAVQQCLMEVGNTLFKELKKGDKDHSIPVLDPMFVTRMTLLAGEKSIHLNLMNSTQSGLGSSVIKSIKADPEHYKFEINMIVPKYVIEGTYDVNAKIAMLPIVGKGPSVITLRDMASTWTVEGTPVVKGGKTYIRLTSFKVNLVPKKMTFLLKDLFNGNKQLGETMNLFMNENWEEVFKQLKPLMESAFSELLLKLSSNIFKKVPYTDMFPDMA